MATTRRAARAGTAATAPERRPLSDLARRRGTLLAVSAALFGIQLDFFALNLALPGISRTFTVGAQAVQWTLSGYMLSLGALFIVGGRLGDILGRRSALLAGCAVFTGTVIGAALAPSLAVLVAFRVLQGAGAGLIFPVGIAVVTNAVPANGRARALGRTFALANVGTALGPFVGGALAQGPGWRWIFWTLVPVSGSALVLTLRFVPQSRDETAQRQVDVPGAAIIAAGIVGISAGVDRANVAGWTSASTIGSLVAGVACLSAFPVRERRVRYPLIDLSLFRNLPFDLVTFMGAVSNISYAVTIFLVSLDVQTVRGLTPLQAGVLFLAPATLVALSGPIGARLQPHFRPTVVMAAAGVVSGLAMLWLTSVTAWWAYVLAFALCGFGLGLGWTFANIATQEVVDPDRAGEASGVVLTILVTFGGIGLAAAATTVQALTHAGYANGSAYEITLRLCAFLSLGASVVVMVIRQLLVRHGLMKPLSMAANRPAARMAGP